MEARIIDEILVTLKISKEADTRIETKEYLDILRNLR